MSTILKTLKKLEEDKKILDKDLDLRELVLQEDNRLPIKVEISRKNFFMIGLILTGVIVASLVFIGRPAVKNEDALFYQAPPPQKIITAIERKEALPTVGIPLSNISEQRSTYEEKVRGNSSSIVKKEFVRELFQPLAEPEPLVAKSESLPPEINEIRDLIQTATSKSTQTMPNQYPEELISSGISIPKLKVKGIIFFSSDSPSNHIFVSTSESKNHKVRVGETVQSATLMHIESNRVVFSYQGETVHLRIGE